MEQPQFYLFNIILSYILLLSYYEDITLLENIDD